MRDWCTGQLNSPGDCKLQALALGFTMEKWAYLNSCYSYFSAEYWLLLWDKRRAVAYRKRMLQNPKRPQRTELKICGMISGDLSDWEMLIRPREKNHKKHHFMDCNFRKDGLRESRHARCSACLKESCHVCRTDVEPLLWWVLMASVELSCE